MRDNFVFVVYFLGVVISVVVGVILGLFFGQRNKTSSPPENSIPEPIPELATKQYNILKMYLEEWSAVINVQMHFNDLILRFRSIMLTVFITLVGTTVAIVKMTSLSRQYIILMWVIVTIFWFTAFILDFFYYHRLLLGAVAQGLKFDASEKLKAYGLFGMTTTISRYVHPPTAKFLVLIYYFFPWILISILLVWFI